MKRFARRNKREAGRLASRRYTGRRTRQDDRPGPFAPCCVYLAAPGDLRTRLHQEAFPGEDISDRPLPEVAVPGLVELASGDLPSGRYQVQDLQGAAS